MPSSQLSSSSEGPPEGTHAGSAGSQFGGSHAASAGSQFGGSHAGSAGSQFGGSHAGSAGSQFGGSVGVLDPRSKVPSLFVVSILVKDCNGDKIGLNRNSSPR